MNKVKKLFAVHSNADEDGNITYYHGAGPTDNTYTRKEEAEEAGAPGGATTDKSQSGFASQGQGSSSYTDESPSGATGSSYDKTPGHSSSYDTPDRASGSNAPQIGRQDLGESLGGGSGPADRRTSGPTSPTTGGSSRSRYSGSGSNFVRGGSRSYGLDKPTSGEQYDTTSTNDPTIRNTGATGTTGIASSSGLASTTSGNESNLDKNLSGEKYGTTSTSDPAFISSSSGATATSGLTGASLADRSVDSTAQTGTRPAMAGQPSYAENPVDMYKDAHPTFTGNRLDPGFHESTQSYHEEVLDDKTHHGAGWIQGSGGSSDDAYAAPGTATTTSGSTATPSYTSGAQSSRDAYSSVPSTQVYAQQTPSSTGEYARDAVQSGGDRAEKAGGYDTYDGREPAIGHASSEHPTTTTTGPGSTGAGAYSAYDGGRVPPTSTTTGQTAAEPHNYKRDAAIVGGAGATGAAGYGAYEATHPQTTAPHDTTAATGTSSAQPHHDPTKPHPHHDPYSTEHHADRDADWRKQSKGGALGFLHKDQHGRYDDKDEQNTTAREKYYGTGNDHATHPLDSNHQDNANNGKSSAAAAATAGAVGAGGAAAGASSLSSRFDHHDPTGPGSTHGTSTGDYTSGYRPNALKESSLKTFHDDPTGANQSHGMLSGGLQGEAAHGAARQEGAEEPHKRSLLDKVLHRQNPTKLQKEPTTS